MKSLLSVLIMILTPGLVLACGSPPAGFILFLLMIPVLFLAGIIALISWWARPSENKRIVLYFLAAIHSLMFILLASVDFSPELILLGLLIVIELFVAFNAKVK